MESNENKQIKRVFEFSRADKFIFPLIEHICKPRKIPHSSVESLFTAKCEKCGSIINSGLLSISAAAIATLSHNRDEFIIIADNMVVPKCMLCGHTRFIGSVENITYGEKELLEKDRLFITLSEPTSTHHDNSLSNLLLEITYRHLHKNTIRVESFQISDSGSSILQEAVNALNRYDDKTAIPLFENAIEEALLPKFKVFAHRCLGDLLLFTDVLVAAKHYLEVLESDERDISNFGHCSVYLASIYRAAGRSFEAAFLKGLADSVNYSKSVNTKVEVKISQMVQQLGIR